MLTGSQRHPNWRDLAACHDELTWTVYIASLAQGSLASAIRQKTPEFVVLGTGV